MPSITRTDINTVVSKVYRFPSRLPCHVWDTLQSDQKGSNIILPHMEKARCLENDGMVLGADQFWIVCCSSGPDSLTKETVDFVMSCTRGPMGEYPIFIYAACPSAHLTPAFLSSRLSCMIERLAANAPVSRVFSVFALHPVTVMFAELWTAYTSIASIPDPYYAAKYTFCTRDTFQTRSMHKPAGYRIRLRQAYSPESEKVAALCYGFAKDSEPFTLSVEDAQREAEYMIAKQQVWVHEIGRRGQPKDIASIVCTTRQSEDVTAITKVYTNPTWRKRGCAERLVRAVCHHILYTMQKEAVTLYVAHENPAANKTYENVGFVGLGADTSSTVGSWLEVGFDREIVKLGHW